MSTSKVLTHVALGQLVTQLPEHIELALSGRAAVFMSNAFTGDAALDVSNYTSFKDGAPDAVNAWALKGWGLDLGLSGDYALAAILNIAMQWHAGAKPREITIDGQVYQGARHENARATDIDGLFEIPVKDAGLSLYVSEAPIDLATVDGPIDQISNVDLSLPQVKLSITEDLSEQFSGTMATVHGESMECATVKQVTELAMDLKGAEVKQAASMTLIRACLQPMNPFVVIEGPFHVYIKVNDRLAFAACCDRDSFVITEQTEK